MVRKHGDAEGILVTVVDEVVGADSIAGCALPRQDHRAAASYEAAQALAIESRARQGALARMVSQMETGHAGSKVAADGRRVCVVHEFLRVMPLGGSNGFMVARIFSITSREPDGGDPLCSTSSVRNPGCGTVRSAV